MTPATLLDYWNSLCDSISFALKNHGAISVVYSLHRPLIKLLLFVSLVDDPPLNYRDSPCDFLYQQELGTPTFEYHIGYLGSLPPSSLLIIWPLWDLMDIFFISLSH